VSAAVKDPYARLLRAPMIGGVAKRAGLPRPPRLERYAPGPVIEGAVLLGAAGPGRLGAALARTLAAIGARVSVRPEDAIGPAAAEAGLHGAGAGALAGGGDAAAGRDERYEALVFDATAIADSTRLIELHRFFHPVLRRLDGGGRVIVIGTPPQAAASTREHTAQRALEGFTRALGKEVGRRGTTVQLVYCAPGAEEAMDSTLRFLLSRRSAYVSGQVITLSAPAQGPAADAQRRSVRPDAARPGEEFDWGAPLAGATALVTGAARGIGAAIAEVLARDGASVVGLDVAAAQPELRALMTRIGGEPMELDITTPDAPTRIAARFESGLDVLVHNAGVTRDRTLAKMPADRWSSLLEINLSSEERINDALLREGRLRAGGRIVCVSSIAGIAGNAGQTNYATAKAGVIGMVHALAPVLARDHGATINAVAPGFIETQMTAAMPFALREAGRRMNSLLQGGLPVDVAEAIAWLASPASAAVNGNVVRVCGQSLLGA
jgi:3-oxoacyl-[acyl-carrier protein] reductase